MATSVSQGETPDHGAGFVSVFLDSRLRIAAKPPKGACLMMWGFVISGKRGEKLVSHLTGFFLSLEFGLSGIDRITSKINGGKGGFEVSPVPFLFQG